MKLDCRHELLLADGPYVQWVAEYEADDSRWRNWLFWNTSCWKYPFLCW